MTKKVSIQNQDINKILDYLPGMVYKCFYDEQWTMKFISKGCKDLTGYNKQEILDNSTIPYSQVIHKKDREKVAQLIKKGVKNNGFYDLEYRIITKDQDIKWVREQGRAVYDKQSNVKYLLGFITDITNSKSEYNELKEIKERLELAIKGANLGIWDWNIKTGEININKNWTEMLGYEQDEIKPHIEEWENLIHEKDKEKVHKSLQKHLKGEAKYYSVEHRLETKDGDYKWVKDMGKVFKRDQSGNPVRAVGIHLDIDEKKRMQKHIRESEEKFRAYIENAPIGVFVIDAQGNIKEVNKHAVKMTGFNKSKLKDKTIYDLSYKDKEVISNHLKRFKNKGEIEIEGEFIKSNDEKFFARINGIALDNNNFIGFVEDIDKRIKMRNRLRKQKAYFEQLFNESTEGIVLLNNKGIILKVNDHFLEIFEYNRDEARGENIDDLITLESRKEEGIYYTEEVMAGNDIKEESVKVTKSGNKINVSIHAFPIRLEEGQIGIYGIYNDITERKREEAKRRYISFHDQLTNLYNRRYFENELDRLNSSRKTPISIIIADIDGLKKVNDTYGHQEGDNHIKNAADIIRNVTRNEDIVARIGGDEFAVLLPNTNQMNAKNVIKRIKEGIDKQNKDSEIPLSVSIGVAVKEKRTSDLTDILKQADAMMYNKKRKKKHEGS